MSAQAMAIEDMAGEIERLRAQLEAAEETIRAIRGNEVDALVVGLSGRERVYALGGADECYRTFVEGMCQGAITVTADGMILYSNQHFSELLGSPGQSMVGRSIYDCIAAENEGSLRALIWEGMSANGVKRQLTLRVRGKADISVAATASPMTVAGVTSVCLLVNDLTESEARIAAEAQNAAKDRFLALLSHELRTPLTPILMVIEHMRLDPGMSAEAREDFAMIRRNIELQMRLVDDLLDLSRVTTGKLRLQREIVSAHTLAKNVVEMLKPGLREKNLRVECEFLASRDVVDGDPARLQQVFWNLMKNAGKFSEPGGKVLVRTRDGDGETILIEVIDEGVGIDPEIMPRIFEAFEQGEHKTKQRLGGLGLGLAIARSLIEAHGGKIWVHSDGLGCGAKFTIALSLADPAKAARLAQQA